MKPINALFVSAIALSLSACSISIEDGAYDYDHDARGDFLTVTLPSGDRESFSCPDEMDVFVVDATDENRGLIYGCRSRGVAVPTLD